MGSLSWPVYIGIWKRWHSAESDWERLRGLDKDAVLINSGQSQVRQPKIQNSFPASLESILVTLTVPAHRTQTVLEPFHLGVFVQKYESHLFREWDFFDILTAEQRKDSATTRIAVWLWMGEKPYPLWSTAFCPQTARVVGRSTVAFSTSFSSQHFRPYIQIAAERRGKSHAGKWEWRSKTEHTHHFRWRRGKENLGVGQENNAVANSFKLSTIRGFLFSLETTLKKLRKKNSRKFPPPC